MTGDKAAAGALASDQGLRHDRPVFPQARIPRSLRRRFAQALPGLVDETVADVAAHVPYYGRVPVADARSEVAATTLRNLQLFSRILSEGRMPHHDDVADLLAAVASRAEERIPLQEVQAAYYAGFRSGWRQLGEVARPGDLAEVIEAGQQMLHYLEFITTRVTEAYVETTTALRGSEGAARADLLAAVLREQDTAADWERAGLIRWPERTLLTLVLPEPRGRGEVGAAVASRRRSRVLRDVLGELAGATVLDGLGTHGGPVLLRGHLDRDGVHVALAGVLRGHWYGGLARLPVHAGAAAAAEETSAVARVGHHLRRTPGVYELGDLVFEVQVTRPGPARDHLLDLLRPLEEQVDLLHTLERYVVAGGRRGETAQALHVHPNTLDYRLGRIRELVGTDPACPHGLPVLRAALLARDYVAGEERRRRPAARPGPDGVPGRR